MGNGWIRGWLVDGGWENDGWVDGYCMERDNGWVDGGWIDERMMDRWMDGRKKGKKERREGRGIWRNG